jgi:hypothetical protein
MSAILTADNRKPLSVSDFFSAPANERAGALASMTAYAERHAFTEREVVHVEAASMPNAGNRLVLLVANRCCEAES